MMKEEGRLGGRHKKGYNLINQTQNSITLPRTVPVLLGVVNIVFVTTW